jgi:hypothetical protein
MDDSPVFLHSLQHPNVHVAQSPWAEKQTLHVAAAYANPCRWRTRRELMNDFRRHMQANPNVRLHVGEIAYGDRPFEVTQAGHPGDFQWRTRSELWHKENLLNLIVQRFPADWRYGAYVDGDFHFTRRDWALEAVHQLQHSDWVQLFSSYSDLGPDRRVLRTTNSFAYNWHVNGFRLPPGYGAGGWKTPAGSAAPYAPAVAARPSASITKPVIAPYCGASGGAWAFRREAFDATGGLLDRCILGHADWFMTFGLVCSQAPDMHVDGYTDEYRRYITAWQGRAALLRQNIGYVEGYAIHAFHGDKAKRGYSTRDTILVKHGYRPLTDVYPDSQGVLQLSPAKPGLRDDIRAYFRSRSEDT